MTNTEIMEKLSTIAANSSIAWIAWIVRYVVDVKQGEQKFKYWLIPVEFLLAAAVWMGTYGLFTEALGIHNIDIVSSIMFIMGVLYKEFIKVLILSAPEIIKNFIVWIIQILSKIPANTLNDINKDLKEKEDEQIKEKETNLVTN